VASLAEDVNVDELRRRARRRLVGAIVLALAAAVIVPMLLESEPKPLGEDVSVRIPPVDDGKFVNRLNDASGKTAAPHAEPPKDAKAPVPSAPQSDVAPAPKADATPPAPAAPAPTTPSPQPEPSAAKTPAKPTPAAAPSAPPPKAANDGGFAVQLAAFSDDKGANALAGRLRRAGYEVYTEPLKTSKGTLWRVRVGPYPSREAASAARDKLKSEGQNGIVAAAH
jgi:DedD protein